MRTYPKKRYLLMLLSGLYVAFAHSCMTMQMSKRQTAAYFEEAQVTYQDETRDIDENTLHYLQTGKANAPTLVFVHGSPGSWEAYKAYLTDPVLLKHFRMIAPDRPGFGKSDFRKSKALRPQAEVLNKLLAVCDNGKPYTLIGHSYGAPLIVQMALLRPEQYQNLVILAGALDPGAEKPEKWRRPLTWFPLKYLVPGALKPSNDELWLLKKDLKILAPKLSQLIQNVLVIHGTHDRLVPYRNVAFMQQAFTSVNELKIITLAEERHFIVWDREQLIKNALMDWAFKGQTNKGQLK